MAFVIYYSGETHQQLASRAGKARSEWYGVGLEAPLAFFDGTLRSPQITVPDSFYPVYKDMIDAARSRKSWLEMVIDSTSTTIDSATLQIRISITPTDSVIDTVTSLRLVAIVYEDSVPYYSFLVGDTTYSPMTVRQVIGDSFGIPINLRFGQDFDTLLATSVSGYNPDRVGVVVSVQDFATKAVLQTAVKRRIKRGEAR
ncbi:MAG: hypothetical protein ABIK49_00525 [candidate division WOR-3 bacterium]